jgi:hypothetical protein
MELWAPCRLGAALVLRAEARGQGLPVPVSQLRHTCVRLLTISREDGAHTSCKMPNSAFDTPMLSKPKRRAGTGRVGRKTPRATARVGVSARTIRDAIAQLNRPNEKYRSYRMIPP